MRYFRRFIAVAPAFLKCAGVVCMTLALCNPAGAAGYPAKTVRIVTGAPGGGGDYASRLIAQGLSPRLGQQVIVDNRGNIAGEIVLSAPADGYSILTEGASFWIRSLLEKTLYDPVRDFAAITLAGSSPNILVVHPSLPASSVTQLIALARAKPGILNYASGGSGGAAHLAGELFKMMAGVDVVHVPYRGTGPAVIALLAGQVHFSFLNVAAAMPHVKAARLRAVAVGSAQPSILTPDLPTVAASGLPGFESVLLLGVFAPAKTPPAIVTQLNQEIVAVLRDPDVKARFISGGLETGGDSAEHFGATIKSDLVKWGKVIKDANIHSE
jgi:tripartite-type tricarboxylate transporter receptor subunit TctC